MSMFTRVLRTSSNLISSTRTINRSTLTLTTRSINRSITRSSCFAICTALTIGTFHTTAFASSPSQSHSSNPSNNQKMAASYGNLLERAAVIEPRGEHKYTLIFIHGLGDSSDGFKDMFEMPPFSETILQNTRVVLPNAPNQPVTINGGMRMPSWYDIYVLGTARMADAREDEVGINKAKESIHQLIRHEAAINQIGTQNIILGGFSQGAACSIYAGMTFPDSQLGAILALSGYLMLHTQYPGILSPFAKSTPVLAYHGKSDPTVPFELAKMSWARLKEHGIPVKFLAESGLGHSLSNDEIRSILMFLNEKIYQKTS